MPETERIAALVISAQVECHLAVTDMTDWVEENKVGTNVSIKVELSNFCYLQLPQTSHEKRVKPIAK
jgi:hypothetical protein